MTLKLRAKVNFPASVTGKGGIAVTKSNGIWTVAPDFGSLTELNSISSPADSQVWIYTPSTEIYNTVTIETLTEAINSLPVSADLDMDSHKITNLATGTDDGDAINKGQADADYMPVDATLTAIAGVTTAADELIYATGADTFDTTSLTAFARTLLDDDDAATARDTLGLGSAAESDTTDFATAAQGETADSALQPGDIGSTVQGYDAALTDIADITFAKGDVLYFNGDNIDNLGAGTDGQFLKTQGAGANPVWETVPGGGDMLSSNNLSDLSNADTALDNLGATATGKALFTAADAEAARTALKTDFATIWLEEFGLSEDNTGSDNNAAVTAAFAAAAGKTIFRCGPGEFTFAASFDIPEDCKLSGAGNNQEIAENGPTTFIKDFDDTYLVGVEQNCYFSDVTITRTSGKTGLAYAYIGDRGIVQRVTVKEIGAKVSTSNTQNCNGWRNLDCVFLSIAQTSAFEVSMFRPGTTYANGITLATGQEYRDSSVSNLNYTVLAAGNGQTTASGNLAADIAAHPTWWKLSTFPYGAPDVNDGKLLRADFRNCSGTQNILIDNAYDTEIDVRIQNKAGYGIVIEHGSRGTHGYAYLEKQPDYTGTSFDDLYFGTSTSGNDIRLGQTSTTPTVSDSTARNTWVSYVNDGTTLGTSHSKIRLLDGNGAGAVLYRNGRIDLRAPAGAQTVVGFYTTTTSSGSITLNGSGTASYNTTCDYRIKTDIEPLSGYWDRINAVKPQKYTMNGVQTWGVIAHELAEPYPHSVHGEKDAVDDEGAPALQSASMTTPENMADIYAALQDIDRRLKAGGF